MRPAHLIAAITFISMSTFLACSGDEDESPIPTNAGGASGNAGTAGTNGTAGTSGTGGTAGTGGAAGTAGTNGTAGESGAAGSSGTAGTSGTSGAAGSGGAAGTSGAAGSGGTAGTSTDPKWGCIGPVTPGTPEAANLTVTIKGVDGLSPTQLLTNADIKACPKGDVACASPLDGGAKHTDSMGQVTFTVPGGANGFDGYFELVDVGGTHYTTLQLPSFPLTKNNTTITIPAAPKATFNAIAGGLAGPGGLDPTRGHMTLGAYDCTGSNDAPGVTAVLASADDKTKIVYGGTIPAAANTSTQSGTSRAFVLNAPVGMSTITATLDGTKTIGTYDTIVRAGCISALGLYPQPQ